MTIFAGHIHMRAGQREATEVVIERCGSPALCGVTRSAIQPKAALMRLIVMVTGIAILQRHRKISKTTRVDMALHTRNAGMFACQLEGKDIVVKILPEAIHPVMTVETGGTKRQCMCGHESQIHLTVTSIARFQCEDCDIAVVAVVTGERFARSRTLVAVE